MLGVRPCTRPVASCSRGINRSLRRELPRRPNLRCRSSGAFNADPHQVLGIPKDADSNRIDAAYRRKKREAELASDSALLSRIEAAHSALFMSSLKDRLSGDGPKDRNVRFADKERLFPWLPRLLVAPKNLIAIAAAMFGVIAMYNFLLTTNPQGVVPSAAVAFGLHTYRQYQLFPAEQLSGQQEKLERGWKNILRGALLAILGTAVGVFASYSAPDYIAAAIGSVLPLWFYENQAALITLGAVVSNFLFVSLLR